MYGVLHHSTRNEGLLVGYLSQRQSFGHVDIVFKGDGVGISLQTNLDNIRLEPAHTFTTDWAYVGYFDTDHSLALRDYFDLVGLTNNARTTGRVPVGWCSWYYLFQGVTEEDIEETVEWAIQHRDDVSLDIIQIDDGFQSEVGDWLEHNTQFSHGMPQMSAQIREAGMRPGLWLAPFIAKPSAKVVENNPGWVLKNRFRLPANPGLVWNTYGRALDVTHPEVLDYVRDVVRTAVREWGFDYLKLDFLYAGALPGVRYDPGLTRAQSLYQALRLIRDEVGEEVFLVGCGCPLGSGIGIFDSMRIGPDVSPSWYPEYHGLERLLKNERGLPSARNAMISTIVRSPMHRRLWINDPDCLLLRTKDTRLTRDELQSLATVISFSGGAILVSDPLPSLSQEKITWLSSLLPPLEGDFDILHPHSTDFPMVLRRNFLGIAGDWALIAIINWDDEGREISLDLGSLGLCASERYHALDFWNARYYALESNQPLRQLIPAHGVRLFSIRTRLEEPQWVGDTLHISQGSGIKTWEVTKGSLRAFLDYGRTTQGSAWLSLPGILRSASVNGRSVSAGMMESGIIKINIKPVQDVSLEISWSEASS
jgi:alpha-galactosidase